MAMNQEQELELDLRQLAQALMRRKWIIVSLFFVAAVTAYVVSDRMTPIYEATTTVLVRDQQSSLNIPGLEGLTTGSRSQIQSSIELFRSRTLARRTAERLGLEYADDSPELAAFRSAISIQPASGSDLIRISVQHEVPLMAQQIANTLVQAYIEENQLMNSQSVRAAREFLQSQLAGFEADLEAAEENLVRYKEQANIVAPSGETEAVLEGITRLESLRAEAEVARQTAQTRYNALRENSPRSGARSYQGA